MSGTAVVERQHEHCPLCKGSDARPLRAFEHARLVKCTACGMVYSQSIPSAEALNVYYADYPYKYDISPITRSRYDELLDRFRPYRRTGRMLDVGCGGGAFLVQAKEKGWQAFGTEYDPQVVADLEKKGIQMYQGPLEEIGSPNGSFDVITSFEVVEHLSFPQVTIGRMVELLRPGGVVYITTPNFNSVSRDLAGDQWSIVNYPEHLSYFTPDTMHRILTLHGMRQLSLRTTGISPMRYQQSRGTVEKLNHQSDNRDEVLRSKLESNRLLRLSKAVANRALSLIGKGDTIKAFYELPVNGDTSSLS